MKRGRSDGDGGGDVFAAIREIDAEDSKEDARRRRRDRRLAEQSRAAQSQNSLYWSLVECRIVLQRSLVGIQKWRDQQQQQQHDQQLQEPRRVEEDGQHKSKTTANPNAEIVKHCDELLMQLLVGRKVLTRKQAHQGDSDDGEDEEEQVSYASVVLNSKRDGAPADESPSPLEKVLQSEYDEMRESWKEILNRRHKDVKLRSGQATSKTQFKVLDSTLWQQVEATAEHEHQHYQMRRNASAAASYLPPMVDDSKVYQQLLKEFLSSHHRPSTSSNDTVQERLRRHKQQSSSNNSSNNKAPVDRKASKGRKIRYHDIPKLQHFAFPVSKRVGGLDPSSTTLLDEEEWFRSLFGGVGRKTNG